MADSKTTDYSAFTPADADLLEVVDVSDTSLAASGTNKKITLNNLLGFYETITEISITGATTATIGRSHVCSGTSAEHIRISAAGMVYMEDGFDASVNQDATAQVRMTCFHEGTNLPVVINTASAIV